MTQTVRSTSASTFQACSFRVGYCNYSHNRITTLSSLNSNKELTIFGIRSGFGIVTLGVASTIITAGRFCALAGALSIIFVALLTGFHMLLMSATLSITRFLRLVVVCLIRHT